MGDTSTRISCLDLNIPSFQRSKSVVRLSLGRRLVNLLQLRANAPTGRVDRNWTEPSGKASYPGFLLVGDLAQVPHTRRRGRLRVAISTESDLSGSGRVDMLTYPVAAARAAVATRASG